MRKLVSATLGLAMLVAQTGAVLADDTASNTQTGPDSKNEANVSQTNNISIKISNDASISYNINLDLNTGNNTVSNNTTAGDLTTGDITAKIVLKDEIIQSGLADCKCLDGLLGDLGHASASNENTGPKSKNEAKVTRKNNLKVDVKNDADVDYKFDITANTGGNKVTNNTTAGDLKTGNITIDIDLITRILQGGVGGFVKPEEPKKDEPKEEPKKEESKPAAAVGGALFPAGSSLLLLLLGLILAANIEYLRRRHQLAFHFNGEGKVGKSRRR
jgi:hypothetical protein